MIRIAINLARGRPVLFEGQARIAFLHEGIAAADIGAHGIVLVDCDDATRARRLAAERRQPELANPTMMAWAKYLREEARRAGQEVLDTSAASIDVCVERVVGYLTP